MPLTTSQKINELKRSFHKYIADNLTGVSIDFDDAAYTPPADESFLVIRYHRIEYDECGIGGVITGDEQNVRGRWRRIFASLAVYKRNDPQKADAGNLYDSVAALLTTTTIPLYDFSNPENPVESGMIYLDLLPASTGPSPSEPRFLDSSGDREMSESGYSYIALNIRLSLLEQY